MASYLPQVVGRFSKYWVCVDQELTDLMPRISVDFSIGCPVNIYKKYYKSMVKHQCMIGVRASAACAGEDMENL